MKFDGEVMVYCNEDMGWGWFFYFKFDMVNFYIEVNDVILIKDVLEWVVVCYYGWCNEFLLIFLNVVCICVVEGLDVSFIFWMNIIILIIFVVIFWLICVCWVWFCCVCIDLVIEDVGDSIVDVGDLIVESRGCLWGWIDWMCGK